MIFALGYINGTAVTAYCFVAPTARLEKQAGGLLIWEFLEELECAKCISHGPNLSC